MLLFTNASVEDIPAQGKAFKWERPCRPKGCAKVWGHGHVTRYLTDLVVILRRFRCPTCGGAYGEKERLLSEKASRPYEIPGSGKGRISRATLLSWITLYRKGGYKIESLRPKLRADRGSYPSLSTTLRMAIRPLKDENEYYTVPVIIKKLRQQKILGADEPVNKATIYRFIRQENLKAVSKDAVDRRRFEPEKSNDLWQCDVLHGPLVEVDGQAALKKAYPMAIIDDHSRYIVHAAFYLAETFETLKEALHQAIARRGLPQKLYVDNGACYRSDQLERTLSCLGIQLSHSPPYRPQGRGKIERCFKNIRDSFFPMLPCRRSPETGEI